MMRILVTVEVLYTDEEYTMRIGHGFLLCDCKLVGSWFSLSPLYVHILSTRHAQCNFMTLILSFISFQEVGTREVIEFVIDNRGGL